MSSSSIVASRAARVERSVSRQRWPRHHFGAARAPRTRAARDDDDDDRGAAKDERERERGAKPPPPSEPKLAPYAVRIHTPPPKDLGTFALAKDVHCGDTIECADDWFIVSRVTTQYNLHRGKYVKDGARLDVQRAGRYFLNESLNKLFAAESAE